MLITVSWNANSAFRYNSKPAASLKMRNLATQEHYEEIEPFVDAIHNYLYSGFRELGTESDFARFNGYTIETCKLFRNMTDQEMIRVFNDDATLLTVA